MAADFVKNLVSGLTRKMIALGIILSLCLVVFFVAVFGISVRSDFVMESEAIDRRVTALIRQQQGTPVGLVAVYTLNNENEVIYRRGQDISITVPTHANAPITTRQGPNLITVHSVIEDGVRELHIYSVPHHLNAPVSGALTFTPTQIFWGINAVTNGMTYSVQSEITLYVMLVMLIVFLPQVLGIMIQRGMLALLTAQVEREVIPTLAEIQDKVVDVVEKRFDAYVEISTDIKVLKHIADSFNQMFSTISEEISRCDNTAQEAKASSENQGHFLANISHEIRTPLNSIYNLSRLVDDKTGKAELYQNLIDIQQASKYLLDIVNDFLDMSKINADKMELDEVAFDIVEIFQSCQMMLQAKADEKGLTLMCHVEPVEGKVLIGDATKLKQVCINLLSNSIKFTNKGDISLTAKVHKRVGSNITIRFTIKDTGIGMTSAQLENIFSPYTQADVHTQRRYGGTGLGMTISRQIIELMGGVLEAESLEGVGTKFSFNLTFHTEPASTAATVRIPNKKHVQRDAPPWYGITALIFEDNKTNQKILQKHLKGVGIESLIAEDGAPGITMYNKNRKTVDVIFMDMNMIEMDGSEATRRLRELGAEQPIILITAMSVTNFSSIYKPQGFTDMIDKTFDKEVLWQLLDKYFEEKPRTIAAQITVTGDSELMADALYDLKNAETQLAAAYADKNWQKAFRVCHSVKGVAMTIQATSLAKLSKTLEQRFQEGASVEEKDVQSLCQEIRRIVSSLTPTKKSVSDEAIAILQTVKELLDVDDIGAVGYVKLLKKIDGTETLVQHLEAYDLMSACAELDLLLRKL